MTSNLDNEVITKFRDQSISDKSSVISRQVLMITDNNQGSYNGQIKFDLDSLATSTNFLSYAEAYIEIPFICSAESVVATVGGTNYAAKANFKDFGKTTVIIKDGYHHFIDSFSIEMEGRTIQQVQPFTNVHAHFRMITSATESDLTKNSATTGFYKDSINALGYSATPSTAGIGYSNFNSVALTRGEETIVFDNTQSSNIPYQTNNNARIENGLSYYTKEKLTGTGNVDYRHHWIIMATIKLGDISDIFNKIPLTKSTSIRLTMNYNSCQFDVGCSAATPPIITFGNYQQISGSCNPIMTNPETLIAYVEAGNATTDGAIRFRINALNSGIGIRPTIAITSARLYVPSYKLADNVSLAMLQSFPTTRIEYNDIYTHTIPSIKANEVFTYTLNTGVINPRYLVICAFDKTNSLNEAGTANRLDYPTYQSPFDTAPATLGGITLTELNCQIAGTNVLQENVRYGWQNFLDQVVSINAVNGNLTTPGISSGLLNYFDYLLGYRYYVFNLSRREDSQNTLTKSITISGRNVSGTTIELICFIAYRQALEIDTATGMLKP